MGEQTASEAAASRLSVDEKATLLAGASFSWTHGAPAIGLEPLMLSDGPNGVRGERFDERDVTGCTPSGTALGASWDPDLLERVGALVGDEALRIGAHVVLGPTINIQRSPLGGRAFESYSEDPVLSGVLAAAWIRGVQSRGVGACAKHLVCNDSETARKTVDCVVDERALREVYLLPFELALEANPWCLMTGYNRVNGEYCAASRDLDRILRREWGWDGLVVGDWYAFGDTAGWAAGSVDLEMPGPGRLFGPALADAVRAGAVGEELLDAKLARLCRLASRATRRSVPPVADQHALLTEAAAAGFVLLKNERRLLPFEPRSLERVAVIGPNASEPGYQGGGSASVNLHDVPTPLEAIRVRLEPRVEVVHELGCRGRWRLPGLHVQRLLPQGQAPSVEYFADPDGLGDPAARELRATSRLLWIGPLPGLEQGREGLVRVSATVEPAASGPHVFSVQGSGPSRLLVDGVEVVSYLPDPQQDPIREVFAEKDARGTIELTAAKPASVVVEMRVAPGDMRALRYGCGPPGFEGSLDGAAQTAAGADAVVLVVGTSEEEEREATDRATTALPGDQDELVRRVLAANPNTVVVVNAGAPVAMPWADEAAAILFTGFPGQAFGDAIADVLLGEREPGGRLPFTLGRQPEDYPAWSTAPAADGRLVYEESVFVGYRHFDARSLEPEFCFGHGLGYGEFEYESVEVSDAGLVTDEPLRVEVVVRNTGKRRAKEVVQLYVADAEASVPRPPRELKAFAAVTLDPGERRTVELELGPRAFAYWEAAGRRWRTEPGTLRVDVGRSSRDIRLSADVVLGNAD